MKKTTICSLTLLAAFAFFGCTKEQTSESEKITYTDVPGIKGIDVDHTVFRNKYDSNDPTDFKMDVLDLKEINVSKSLSPASYGYSYFMEIGVMRTTHTPTIGPYGGHTAYLVENVDLNKGAGGKYLYLYAILTNDFVTSIKGVDVRFGYYAYISGWSYFFDFYRSVFNPDMNEGAGGQYVRGFYDNRASGTPVTAVGVIYGSSPSINPPAGWIKIPYDLNAGAGGDYMYIIYR